MLAIAGKFSGNTFIRSPTYPKLSRAYNKSALPLRETKRETHAFSWPLRGKFVLWSSSTVSHFHVKVDSNALKRKRGSPRGGGGGTIHANVNTAKRELRNALFSSQKRKVFYCQLSQRFSRRHSLLGAKGEFVRKLLEVKIMKTWVGRLFTVTLLKPKIGNAQSLFFEWKQNFLKRDQNATTWKRGPVLAKRSEWQSFTFFSFPSKVPNQKLHATGQSSLNIYVQ